MTVTELTNLKDVVDTYTAQMTLAVSAEGSHESWGFIWHGAYVRAIIHRAVPTIQVLTYHSPEERDRIVAFIKHTLKKGNISGEEED